jgi:hypothetical protein
MGNTRYTLFRKSILHKTGAQSIILEHMGTVHSKKSIMDHNSYRNLTGVVGLGLGAMVVGLEKVLWEGNAYPDLKGRTMQGNREKTGTGGSEF